MIGKGSTHLQLPRVEGIKTKKVRGFSLAPVGSKSSWRMSLGQSIVKLKAQVQTLPFKVFLFFLGMAQGWMLGSHSSGDSSLLSWIHVNGIPGNKWHYSHSSQLIVIGRWSAVSTEYLSQWGPISKNPVFTSPCSVVDRHAEHSSTRPRSRRQKTLNINTTDWCSEWH